MPATQQVNSPSRQASGSSQGPQSVPVTKSPITSETINAISKALNENDFNRLREIASTSEDYKELVEKFTSRFVNKKKQFKMNQMNQQGASTAKTTGNNVQFSASSENVTHQKIVTQNVNSAAMAQSSGLTQVRFAGVQSSNQQVMQQFRGQQPHHPQQLQLQHMSPDSSDYSTDTNSSDEECVFDSVFLNFHIFLHSCSEEIFISSQHTKRSKPCQTEILKLVLPVVTNTCFAQYELFSHK